MTCEGAKGLKEKYVYNLIEGIKKVQNAHHLSVEWIVSYIRACLKREDHYEHNTMQSFIGIQILFRGWIVKNWEDSNETQPKKMHNTNKVIARHSVKFYAKAWQHRNDVMHDPVKHRSFVIDWYEQIKDLILAEKSPDIKKYLRSQELDVEECAG